MVVDDGLGCHDGSDNSVYDMLDFLRGIFDDSSLLQIKELFAHILWSMDDHFLLIRAVLFETKLKIPFGKMNRSPTTYTCTGTERISRE